MNYKFFPHTQDDLQAMMEKVGCRTSTISSPRFLMPFAFMVNTSCLNK